MYHRRGMTLIEIMVVMAIVAITFLIVTSVAGAGCVPAETRVVSAEENARLHAQKMGWRIVGVACTGQDSDRDGYVSCTVQDSEGPSRALLCGYEQAFAPMGQQHGCKDPRPIGVQIPVEQGAQ